MCKGSWLKASSRWVDLIGLDLRAMGKEQCAVVVSLLKLKLWVFEVKSE